MSATDAIWIAAALSAGVTIGVFLGGIRSSEVTITEEVEVGSRRATLRASASSVEKAQAAIKMMRDRLDGVS